MYKTLISSIFAVKFRKIIALSTNYMKHEFNAIFLFTEVKAVEVKASQTCKADRGEGGGDVRRVVYIFRRGKRRGT